MVKMSAAPLLLMNSLCQMLDTAYASRVLLKNGRIYMTKADGFRVLRREGGREGWGGGGSEGRQETDWDSWTDALGSLALSQSGDEKTLLDMLDTESGADLGLIPLTHGVCSQITRRDVLLLWRKMGILRLRVQQ